MQMPIPRRPQLVAYLCLLLAACGGGGGGSAPPPAPAPPPPPAAQSFSVGGTVSGLDAAGGGLVLQNSGGPDLPISGNGAFTFPAQVASGAAYSVTIKTQPNVGPLQLCSLTNASGTVASSAVTNVTITCTLRVFKFLYVTSSATNDVRGYSINAATGALTALAQGPVPVDPGPTMVIPHPSGKFLFLPTTGAGIDPPSVSVYAADNTTGALAETNGSPYPLHTPPPPAPFILLAHTIHPSGTFGYLQVLSIPSLTSTLYGATIDAATGALTEIPGTPLDAGSGTAGLMTYDPTGNFVFVPVSVGGAGEIRSFSVNVPSGVLTPIGTFPTSGNGPFGAFLSPGGDYLLTTNISSGTLMVFSRTGGTLTPVTTPISTGPAGSRPAGIQFNRRNNVFYTTNFPSSPPLPPAPASVATFAFDAATGGATAVGAPVSTNGAGTSVLLHVSGRFLFQHNSAASSIQRYVLDATTGAPTLVPDFTPLPGAPANVSIIFDPSGKFLYLLNPAVTTLSSYSIDAVSGALTLIDAEAISSGSLTPFLLQ